MRIHAHHLACAAALCALVASCRPPPGVPTGRVATLVDTHRPATMQAPAILANIRAFVTRISAPPPREDAGTSSTAADAGVAALDAGDDVHGDAGANASDAGTAIDVDAGAAAGDAGTAGCTMVESSPPDEGDTHVDAGSLVVYRHNPPASGNHWPIWARYDEHDEEVPRPVYVHNLEHGAIVLLAGPNAAPDVVQALKDVYASLPVDIACLQDGALTPRALWAFDPDLDDAVAVIAWDHVLEGSCVNADQVLAFVDAYRGISGEDICADGPWPYPPGVWPDHINDP